MLLALLVVQRLGTWFRAAGAWPQPKMQWPLPCHAAAHGPPRYSRWNTFGRRQKSNESHLVFEYFCWYLISDIISLHVWYHYSLKFIYSHHALHHSPNFQTSDTHQTSHLHQWVANAHFRGEVGSECCLAPTSFSICAVWHSSGRLPSAQLDSVGLNSCCPQSVRTMFLCKRQAQLTGCFAGLGSNMK